MLVIGSKKLGKFCGVVKKEGRKVYVCGSSKEEEPLVYAVCYAIENDLERVALKHGGKFLVLLVRGDEVEVEEVEIPEGQSPEDFFSSLYAESPPVFISDVSSLARRYRPRSLVPYFVVLALVVSLFGAYYVKKSFEEEKKRLEELRKKKKMRGRRLSPSEIEKLKKRISAEFIQKTFEVFESVGRFQRLRFVSLRYVRKVPRRKEENEEFYGVLSYTKESAYPVEGSFKSGNYYVVSRNLRLNGSPVRFEKSPKECLEFALRSGADLVRTSPLTFDFTSKDFFKTVEFLKGLYGCSFYFERASLSRTSALRIIFK